MAVDLSRSILLLDKPVGPTSFSAAQAAARRLGVSKAGHTGTLDANVSGVLVVALGEATKAVSQLVGLDKGYRGTMRLSGRPSAGRLRRELEALTGRIVQIPPLKSAVRRRPRERTVHRFEITDLRGEEADFVAEVEAGTYVRALLRDLGMRLGFAVEMRSLRRVNVGPFRIEECVPLDRVAPEHAMDVVAALERVGLERVVLSAREEADIRFGRPIRAGRAAGEEGVTKVLVSEEGRIVALSRVAADGLRPFRVFVE